MNTKTIARPPGYYLLPEGWEDVTLRDQPGLRPSWWREGWLCAATGLGNDEFEEIVVALDECGDLTAWTLDHKGIPAKLRAVPAVIGAWASYQWMTHGGQGEPTLALRVSNYHGKLIYAIKATRAFSKHIGRPISLREARDRLACGGVILSGIPVDRALDAPAFFEHPDWATGWRATFDLTLETS